MPSHSHLCSLFPFPPLSERLAMGRPVLGRDQMQEISEHIMQMTSAPVVEIAVTNIVQVATRLARGEVLLNDDGDMLKITVSVGFGGATGQQDIKTTQFRTNQLDVRVLKAIVAQCEAINRERLRSDNVYPIQPKVQDSYVPVQLWHDSTIDAMRETRAPVLSELLQPVRKAGLTAAGFVGFTARSDAYFDRGGIHSYCEETDSEVTVTACGENGEAAWNGQAARDWTKIDPTAIVAQAINIAKQSANPAAVEPGRRTAILSPFALGQIMQCMPGQFVEGGDGGFGCGRRKIRWGGRYFDPRITMTSNPADVDGGYRPFFAYGGYATPAVTWVEHGILKNLANEPGIAMTRGKVYMDIPESIRVAGGPTSLEEMIAQCDDGIYVNRFYGVEMVDRRTGLMTGVTRDGCFLVRHGKIEKAVKNFRFLESPFFFLNNLEAIGPTARVSLGFAPNPWSLNWPVPPIIVPPVMVRDFNFSGLVDAI